jgi:hypothetical protein
MEKDKDSEEVKGMRRFAKGWWGGRGKENQS